MRRTPTTKALGPYKEPNGTWRVVYKATRKGKGRRETEIFDSRRTAQEAIDAFNEATQANHKTTIARALELFEKEHKTRGNKKTTIDTSLGRLHSFFPEADRERYMRSLSPAYCAARYKALTELVATDTHRNTLKEASRFFRWCITQKFCDLDPTIGIEPVGRKHKGKAQLRLNEARQLTQLIETLFSIIELPNPLPALEALEIRPPGWYRSEKHLPKYRKMLACGVTATLTALVLGMRAGEIVGRKARDLDDGGRLLWVGEEHLDDTKTESSRRLLQVPELLKPRLLSLAKGLQPEEPLFGESGRKMVHYWVQKLTKIAGVPVVCAHGLRGSFASLSTAQGIAPTAVAAALGHSSVVVTEAHYTRPEAKANAHTNFIIDTLERP